MIPKWLPIGQSVVSLEPIVKQQSCSISNTFVITGPLWLGPMASESVIKQMVACLPDTSCGDVNKTSKLLGLLEDEITNGPNLPYFHDLHALAKQSKDRNYQNYWKCNKE